MEQIFYLIAFLIGLMTVINMGILISGAILLYIMNKQYTEIFKERSISARIGEKG